MKTVGIATIALACLLSACSREAPVRSAASTAAQLNDPASSSDGARIYITNCSSCHQLDGRGVAGAFPALAGNPAVTGDPRAVVADVKFGLRARSRANREGFAVMPAWQGLLSDEDIAAVVTYVRFAWHNHASAVTPAEVTSVGGR